MTDLYLKLEAEPGAEIERTAKEAQRVADMLAIDVRFGFNGVKCTARPGGDAGVLAQRQQDAQRSDSEHKWANSRTDGLAATTKLDNASTKPTEAVPGPSALEHLKKAALVAECMSRGDKKFSLWITPLGVEIVGEFFMSGQPSRFGETRFRSSWEAIEQGRANVVSLALREVDKSLEKLMSDHAGERR